MTDSTSASRRTITAVSAAILIAGSLSIARTAAQGQIVAGQNRNVAGGPVKWSGQPFVLGSQLLEGDPFGQRQDEISCSPDSRNPLNLFCAFNDYTPTELGGANDCETRDAWVGTAWSTDGGVTWRNALLPGYPQDQTLEGSASTLRGFSTGADPTVRSGPNGRMYLLGIAFNRPGQTVSCADTTTGSQAGGVVYVQTYVNNNNIENNPRPFQPVGKPIILDQGNTGTVFQDKPWLAVGPDGSLHVAYATFVGGNKPIGTIWYQYSKDGVNWQKSKLSEGDKLNNGTMLVVHPTTGWVDVTWRRRDTALANQSSAIQFVRSTDGGKSFTAPVTVASLTNLTRAGDATTVSRAFDQGSASYAFRNISNPAISADGQKRVYIAWSERYEHTVNGILRRDAVIKMVVGTPAKANGNQVTWSPQFIPDPLPENNPELARGHQLRPALWFAFGKLMLSYMETRDDDRVSYLQRSDVADPGRPGTTVPQYTEHQFYRGDLPADPTKVFNDFIFDIGPTTSLQGSDVNPFPAGGTTQLARRHTEDVMALMMRPAAANADSPIPIVEGTTKVSRYATAFIPDPNSPPGRLQQVQFNVLGRALHCGGNCAFAGDYDDVVAQSWTPDGNGKLIPNTALSNTSTFYVAWTDNRDVFPFTTSFSRVGPSCTDGKSTGTRNQNPYIAPVGTGLFLFSFGNQKPLRPDFARAFTVVFRNAVNATKNYRATITTPSLPGGFASWRQFDTTVQTINLAIGPFSTATRALYAKSTDPDAPIIVQVQELDAQGNPAGLQSSIVLNPNRGTFTATNPFTTPINDGVANQTNPNTAEIFIPDATSPDATSANVVTPDATSPDATSPDATSPDATSVAPWYPDATSPDATSPDATSPDATSYPSMTPDATSPDATSNPPGSVTDTIYAFRNKSNTAAAFAINTLLEKQLCPGCKLQLLVMKPSLSPTQRPGTNQLDGGCAPRIQDTSALVAKLTLTNAPINDPNAFTFDPTNGSPDRLTVAVPPGGKLSLIYRLFDPNPSNNTTFVDGFGRRHSIDPVFNPATDLRPITIAQSVSTPDIPAGCPATPSLCPTQGQTTYPVIITTLALADGTVGKPYSQQVFAQGGVGQYTWSVDNLGPSYTLPPGLTLSPSTGVISGTPTTANTEGQSFRLRVTDSQGNTATRDICIHIQPAPDPGPITATAQDKDTVAAGLAGDGVIIVPGSVSYTGASVALGTFTGGYDATGLNAGVILSSGSVSNINPGAAPNYNTSDSTTMANGAQGDADLDALVNGFTQDAAVLEFDFQVTDQNASVLRFDYVFASEEYNEYVYSGFNDVFAFFIKEKNNPNSSYINYALVPGTRNPVAIDNVNGGNPYGTNASHPELFVNNDLNDGGGTVPTEADGLTKVLELAAPVTPGTVYHMKVVIGDRNDAFYDSWVLIKKLQAVCPIIIQ